MFILDPPVILAESTKGFTLTCNAWDLIVITDPPRPPIVPNTTAKCHIFSSAKADIIKSKGRVGSINIRSDCLMRYESILPPKKAAIVPRIVEIPTPSVALSKPKTNATWLPSIIWENTSLPKESVPRICLREGGAGCKFWIIVSPTCASE